MLRDPPGHTRTYTTLPTTTRFRCDVEHAALRALEKDAAAAAARLVEALPDAVGEGQDTRRQREQAGDDLVGGELRLAEAAQQRVVVHKQAFHAQAKQVGLGEVAEPDGAAGGRDRKSKRMN